MSAQPNDQQRPSIDPRQLIAQGFSVFPLEGKQPNLKLLPRGVNNKPTWIPFTIAPADEIQIARWAKAAPNANYAIVLGRVSGVFVIDIDDPASCPELVDRLMSIETMAVQTACGWHFYFCYPADRMIPHLSALLPNVECRSDDHYCVAPGSIHPGNPKKGVAPGTVYTSNGLPPIDAPQWLIDKIDAAAPKPSIKAIVSRAVPIAIGSSDQAVRHVEIALKAIDPMFYADYDSWIKIGKALYNLGAGGLALWESITMPGRDTCEDKWDTFATGKKPIALKWLFKLAHGYDRAWQKRCCCQSCEQYRTARQAMSAKGPVAVLGTEQNKRGTSALHAGTPLSDNAISALLNIAPEFTPIAYVMAATGIGVNAPVSVTTIIAAGKSIGVSLSRRSVYNALSWATERGIVLNSLPTDLCIGCGGGTLAKKNSTMCQLVAPDALIAIFVRMEFKALIALYFGSANGETS